MLEDAGESLQQLLHHHILLHKLLLINHFPRTTLQLSRYRTSAARLLVEWYRALLLIITFSTAARRTFREKKTKIDSISPSNQSIIPIE